MKATCPSLATFSQRSGEKVTEEEPNFLVLVNNF